MSTFGQDIRFAIRSLWLRPGFTAVAALTLALGIGANTAIFSTVDGVLIRPMPYPDSERLVVLWESSDERGMPFMNVAPPNFEDWKARVRSFERMAVWRGQSFTVSLRQGAEQVHGAGLSHEMFDVLKVAPLMGRTFTEAEDVKGGASVAVISERLWRRLFGADRSAVGKTVTVDGVAREIVGVMPASFKFPPPVAFEGGSARPPASAARTTCWRLGACGHASRSTTRAASWRGSPRRSRASIPSIRDGARRSCPSPAR
jgi:hypothetical protein